ncbi:unnamed protein product [Soboliphyme baturini]|uniref:Rho-GAP domain-containing protein n=1 Tax=Soboliphyme baturini TaxID=241478 RepID=A0A3P7ZMS8_9BILA|nr:unnamed protein product [Soboliphyme baturini]
MHCQFKPIKKTLTGDSFHGVTKKKLYSSSLSDGNFSISGELSLKQLAHSETDYIPAFVRKCVEFIETEGIKVEGLYRVPGNQSQVVLIEQKFAVDANMSMYALDLPVSAVTTALKNFFANLSEPLISAELYQPLIEERRPDVRLKLLRHVLQRLPLENRAVLSYVVNHLRHVAEHVHVTSMDHRNLAKCWWPTLVRPHFENFESMAMMSQPLEELVQVLLDNPSILE